MKHADRRFLKLFALCALFHVGAACSDSFNPFPGRSDSAVDAPVDPDSAVDAASDLDSAADAAELDGGNDAPVMCPPLLCDVREYLSRSCGTSACHGARTTSLASNYETGDVFARLLGTPSGQFDSTPSNAACSAIPLIDPSNPDNSMLLRTLRGTQGGCGERMPFSGVASPEEVECVESWIARELCLRGYTGADAGPGRDAGPGPAPSDAGPRDRARDPRPLTDAEAACLGLTQPECAGCHQEADDWFGTPHWAPAGPSHVAAVTFESCGVPPNALSPEAVRCFGLDSPSCAVCHTAADGNIYLRPWFTEVLDGASDADQACYDLL